ncbi:MAG: hypothetical protein M3Y60_05995 [Bacteroidota bacterium]|nr:hypothetical protein [Bacteroidota bacterium]
MGWSASWRQLDIRDPVDEMNARVKDQRLDYLMHPPERKVFYNTDYPQ